MLLKTAPVDPRDLLRGDYVVLNYDISSVPVIDGHWRIPAKAGEQTLWVRLKRQQDGFWGIVESSFKPLPAQPDTVVLSEASLSTAMGLINGDMIRVEYGIERYYVPEGEGHAAGGGAQRRATSRLPHAFPPTALRRSAASLVDGKPVYEEPLY